MKIQRFLGNATADQIATKLGIPVDSVTIGQVKTGNQILDRVRNVMVDEYVEGIEIEISDLATPDQVKRAKQLLSNIDLDSAKLDAMDAARNAVADINTYLAIPAPTNAQVAAEVRLLSQACRRIIMFLAKEM